MDLDLSANHRGTLNNEGERGVGKSIVSEHNAIHTHAIHFIKSHGLI